jgi:hypothetical protein
MISALYSDRRQGKVQLQSDMSQSHLKSKDTAAVASAAVALNLHLCN